MPRLSHSVPKYRKHKASGQAVVTLSGRDFYLGPYGTAVSKRAYDRIVGEWQANGRRLHAENIRPALAVLMSEYWKFAKGYYVKNDKPKGSLHGIKAMLREFRGHQFQSLLGSRCFVKGTTDHIDWGKANTSRSGNDIHKELFGSQFQRLQFRHSTIKLGGVCTRGARRNSGPFRFVHLAARSIPASISFMKC